MDDWDSLSRYQYETAQVYAHAPSEFELKPSKLSWDSPCWLDANITLIPRNDSAKQDFVFPLSMPHKIDAFARVSWEEQLWKLFGDRLAQVTGPHADAWRTELYRCYEGLKAGLHQTASLFQQPFHFVARQEFTTVDLPTVLGEDPEEMSVYVAEEKGSYRRYMHLRIHTSLPHFGSNSRCLWFEKRLPDVLYSEDVVPWLVGTVGRLPAKHRPASVEPWTKRLLHFEPQLALPTDGIDKPWQEKPRVVLVLGPTSKVGYRALTHFERRDISHIVQQGEVVRVEGKERYTYSDGKTLEVERSFYLLAFDEAAAQRVERRLLSGEQVHFGLDADVLGMICQSSEIINAINAPEDTIRRLCVKPGYELRLIGDPRHKLKMYETCVPGTPRLEDFADLK